MKHKKKQPTTTEQASKQASKHVTLTAFYLLRCGWGHGTHEVKSVTPEVELQSLVSNTNRNESTAVWPPFFFFFFCARATVCHVSYHTIPYNTVSYYIIQGYTIPHNIISYHIVPYQHFLGIYVFSRCSCGGHSHQDVTDPHCGCARFLSSGTQLNVTKHNNNNNKNTILMQDDTITQDF